MERETNPMQTRCRSGCGFYGNPATDGLCSVCYKDALRKKQQQPVNNTPVATAPTTTATATATVPSTEQDVTFDSFPIVKPITNTNTAQPTVQSLPSADPRDKMNDLTSFINESDAGPSNNTSSSSSNPDKDDEDTDVDKDSKKKKNRCGLCRKKVGLTGFECRCGGLFCAVHRYSDKHDCTFDYKEHGAQEIRRNNPVVVGEKIQKI